MADSKELRQLLRALDEGDVSLGQDDVAWAFDASTRSEMETWVHEYLSPACLLTHEELTLYGRSKGDSTTL